MICPRNISSLEQVEWSWFFIVYIIKSKSTIEKHTVEAHKFKETMDEMNVKMAQLIDVMQSDGSAIEACEHVVGLWTLQEEAIDCALE